MRLRHILSDCRVHRELLEDPQYTASANTIPPCYQPIHILEQPPLGFVFKPKEL